MVEKADRHIEGTVHASMIKEDTSYSYNASDLYPCSPEHGCLKLVWKLDQDTIDEDFECPIFDLEINEGNELSINGNNDFRTYRTVYGMQGTRRLWFVGAQSHDLQKIKVRLR